MLLSSLFLLGGICFFMFSCSLSLEQKIKKYEGNGKTIIASTLGQETNYPCVVFADGKGVYVDNLKDVFQIFEFDKEYTSVIPSLSIPCDNSGLQIEMVRPQKFEFSTEDIDHYDFIPIGEWATFLHGREGEDGGYYSDFIVKNGSDTIYNVYFDNLSWYSKYQLQYASLEEDDVMLAPAVEEGTEPKEYLSLKVNGTYEQFLNECDKLTPYFTKCEPEFFEWLKYHLYDELYYAHLSLNPERFFEAPNVTYLAFLNREFQISEIGTQWMYEQVAKLVYGEYLKAVEVQRQEQERVKKEQLQSLVEQSVNFLDFLSLYMNNSMKAQRTYPIGETMIFKLKLEKIKDGYYSYELVPDSYILTNINMRTNDESFTELDYPCYVIVQTDFTDCTEGWDGQWYFTFKNTKLLAW